MSDPLKRAIKSTPQYKLQEFFDEESRWKRKATIAQNKLADVRDRINRLASEQLGLTKPKAQSESGKDADAIGAADAGK